jgi:hypothetical protein
LKIDPEVQRSVQEYGTVARSSFVAHGNLGKTLFKADPEVV